jgi:hypothetical protein
MRNPSLRRFVRRFTAMLGVSATLGMMAADQAAGQAYWRSGMSCHYGNMLQVLESWRGTPFSALHGWAPQDTWQNLLVFFSSTVGSEFAAKRGNGRVLAISTPLLTAESRGQFAQCAAGAFDNHFRGIAQRLVWRGATDAIIRLGWEANGTWFPWSINGNYSGFKSCFRRAVQVMRSVVPNLKIEWSMNREAWNGKYQNVAANAYPGDDVVNIIGLSYYDQWPAATSEAVWNSSFKPELDFWANFARSRGKQLAFGEWGLGNKSGGGFDNPFYIRKMREFFAQNASLIAYEAYFNCEAQNFRVYPEWNNPRAAATYKSLF